MPKNLKIGIIGLGYVGLPLAVTASLKGHDVIGFEIDKNKIDLLTKGQNYIKDIRNEDLEKVVSNECFKATNDFSLLSNCEFIAICTPTPLDKFGQPDLSTIINASEQIAKHLSKGAFISLESTTYPTTTEDILKPILEKSGLECSKDFFLAFSPERIDPGNELKTKEIPKVVGAIGGKKIGERFKEIYETIIDSKIHLVTDAKTAEMVKILENTYRHINIGLVNEFARMGKHLGINIWEVIEAAKTKPYGFQAFYPGPGLGGHCIPLDPSYLAYKMKEYNYHFQILESSSIINDSQPGYIVRRAQGILNENKKSLSTSKALIIGIAYKKDIDDCRESPAHSIIHKLESLGSEVDYYDPFIKGLRNGKESIENLDRLESYDITIIVTDHSNIDWKKVVQNSKVVLDTRNATKEVIDRPNVELL